MSQPVRKLDAFRRLAACRISPHSPLYVRRGVTSSAAKPVVGLEQGESLPTVEQRTARANDGLQSEVVDRLAREVRALEMAGRKTATGKAISTGCPTLDACLPHRGYVPGSVIEYLRASPACGASYLASAAAASAMCARQGYLVVVDTQWANTQWANAEATTSVAKRSNKLGTAASRQSVDACGHVTYPPALAAQGIDLERVIFVRPRSAADAMWAIDQSLRNSAVVAVVAELERIDDRSARRLQLAAEAGRTLALLLRSKSARHAPSWAEVQLLVRACAVSDVCKPEEIFSQRQAVPNSPIANAARAVRNHRQLQVQLLRNRGGKPGASLKLEIDRVTGAIRSAIAERNQYEQKASLRLATELARPKNSSRRAAAG